MANDKGDKPILPVLSCPVLSAHVIIKEGPIIVRKYSHLIYEPPILKDRSNVFAVVNGTSRTYRCFWANVF